MIVFLKKTNRINRQYLFQKMKNMKCLWTNKNIIIVKNPMILLNLIVELRNVKLNGIKMYKKLRL